MQIIQYQNLEESMPKQLETTIKINNILDHYQNELKKEEDKMYTKTKDYSIKMKVMIFKHIK